MENPKELSDELLILEIEARFCEIHEMGIPENGYMMHYKELLRRFEEHVVLKSEAFIKDEPS